MVTSTTDGVGRLPPVPRADRPKLVGDATLATILFVFAEAMLFAGLMSAFTIVKNSVTKGRWPPAGQPRLPIWETAINTSALLASGVVLFVAYRAFKASDLATATKRYGAAVLLGAAFVLFQGIEWAMLLREGLTIRSSQLGSFFYLIVGTHALHVIGALIALAIGYGRLKKGTLTEDYFAAAALFWYFVVLVWPILYFEVYL